MKSILFVITALFLLFSATSSMAEDYFPNKMFSEEQEYHDFVVEWYSKHLLSMNEKSLWQTRSDKSRHEYRFTSLPTWGNPVVISFEIDREGNGKVFVKKSDGHGGYDAGKLVLDKVIELDSEQTEKLTNQLNELKFWELPTKIDRMGVDGAQWVMEGIKDGEYHIVDRWTPESGKFYETCNLFFELAKIR